MLTMRKKCPAGTSNARASRGGTMMSPTLVKVSRARASIAHIGLRQRAGRIDDDGRFGAPLLGIVRFAHLRSYWCAFSAAAMSATAS